MRRVKTVGFILCLVLWAILSFLCYYKIIVFDTATIGGAMLSGFILSTSILSIISLLKKVYDGTYSDLAKENN